MVSKVERERAALEAAEQDIAERKKRLAQMEKDIEKLSKKNIYVRVDEQY